MVFDSKIPTNTTDNMLLLGKINGVFGVKGWVKILSYTEVIVSICEYLPFYIKEGSTFSALCVKNCKAHSKTIIASIDNIDTCDKASLLLGVKLYINKSQLPKIARNEYYCSELEGMSVFNKESVALGVLEYLFTNGASDIMVVKNNSSEHLIPFTATYLVSISKKHNKIIVDWQKSY